MQITIGGVPGAGKSTVAKLIAEKLGYKAYSMGDLRRKLAEEKGLTIHQLNSLPENTDGMVDEYQKKLGKEGDNFVNEGRLAFYFMPESVKIYLSCNEKVAAERIFRENRAIEGSYASAEEVVKAERKRFQSDMERYGKYYGVNCYDTSQFDHIIDTTSLTVQEVVEKILEIVEARAK